MRLWSTHTGELLKTYEAHTARIKAVVAVQYGSQTYFVSSSSDGTVHLWRKYYSFSLIQLSFLSFRTDADVDTPLATVETNSRITSLSAILDLPIAKDASSKRKAEPTVEVESDRSKKSSTLPPVPKSSSKHKNH